MLSSRTCQVMWKASLNHGLEWFFAPEWTEGTSHSFNGLSLQEVEGRPVSIHYAVETDHRWRTRSATIDIMNVDSRHNVEWEVSADGKGTWTLPGLGPKAEEQFAGFLDIDFGFSPVTNILPIRKLKLVIGESAPVSAVWVRFPEFTIEPLHQTYTRISDDTYRYASDTGFEGDITVDDRGIPIKYADL